MCALVCAQAHAQHPAIESWAQWAVGPRQQDPANTPLTPFSPTRDRPPERALILPSIDHPLAVHATPEAASVGELERVLAALERAHDLLAQRGWPSPPGDGGRAAGAGFDVYLEPTAEPAGTTAELPLPFGALDGASAFGWLSPRLDDERLEACAVALLVDAALLGEDPAEALAMRRATADFVALQLTGALCHGDFVAAQQQPYLVGTHWTDGERPDAVLAFLEGQCVAPVFAEVGENGAVQFHDLRFRGLNAKCDGAIGVNLG
jgi:hypothetical protein